MKNIAKAVILSCCLLSLAACGVVRRVTPGGPKIIINKAAENEATDAPETVLALR